MANKQSKNEAVMFWADKETIQAIRIVTKTLGRGNKSDGIRRALIETAERIQLVQRASVEMPEAVTASLTPKGEQVPCGES